MPTLSSILKLTYVLIKQNIPRHFQLLSKTHKTISVD